MSLVASRRRGGSVRRWWRALAVLLIALPLGAIVEVTAQGFEASAGGVVPRHPVTIVRTRPPSRVAAGRVSWQPTAIRVETDALVEDPDTPARLFAGTIGGVYSSSDFGATWRQAGSGITNGTVLALAAYGHAGVFAGDNNGLVYHWDAVKARWRGISRSLNGNPIFSLAVAPTRPAVVLAGTIGAVFRGTQVRGQWRWQLVARSGDSSITSIVWDPRSPSHAFASIFGSTPPVLRTLDRGHTWSADTQGLPSSLPTESLLFLPGSVARLVLSTMGGGVWQRLPGGEWKDISGGLPERHAMPLAVSRGLLYGATMGQGVYVRRGSGPWDLLDRGLIGGQYVDLSLLTTPAPHRYLLVGTSQGVYRRVLPA